MVYVSHHPIVEDVKVVVIYALLVFSLRVEGFSRMGFIHLCENVSLRERLTSRYLDDLEASLQWRYYVVEGDVIGRGHGVERVDNVLGAIGRNMLWYVVWFRHGLLGRAVLSSVVVSRPFVARIRISATCGRRIEGIFQAVVWWRRK